MHKVFAVVALFAAGVTRAQEPAAAADYTNIALVRAGLTNLSAGGGIGLEHQFAQKLTGIISVGFSYNSTNQSLLGGAGGLTTGASPGIRYYLGDQALSGVFLGVEVPFQFQWTSSGMFASAGLGIGLAPEVGVSIRFDRLVVQLDFGIGVVGRIPLSNSNTMFGTLYPGGFSITLSSGVALGYIF